MNSNLSQQEWHWPAELSMVAGSGVGVTVAKTWTQILTAETGMKVTIAPESATVNRLKWVGLGLFHLTAGGTGNTGQMLEAEGPYASRDGGPFPVRAVWPQSTSASGFFVRGDSRLKTPRDLSPGTRVVDMTYVGSQKIVDGLLAWAGLTRDDVVWVPAGNAEEKTAVVMEGRADVAFGTPTSKSMYQAEKDPNGIRWLSLNSEEDPEGARRFLEIDPLIGFTPMVSGVPSCRGVWGAGGTSFYCTRQATDAGLVYHLVRWLDDNWAKYRTAHEWNEYMTRSTLMEELGHTFIPAHEGLVTYLKELGLWTEAHQRRHQENVSLIERYYQAYQAAMDLANDRLIPVSPDNEEWLKLWGDYQKEQGLPGVRMFLSLEA